MTVRKIATLANLSPSTVYRALKCPEKAKKEVLEAIHLITNGGDLKNFLVNRFKIVYVIFPHSNIFYSQIILEITSLLLDHNIKVIPFITGENEEKEKKFFDSLVFSSKVCILWSPTTQYAPAFLKRKKDKPFVILFNRTLKDHRGDMELLLDNYYASQIATDALISNQHKNILYIGASPIYTTARDRADGFSDTVNKNKDVQGEILVSDFHNWLSTYNLLKDYPLGQHDAILCGNEIITYGAIKALKKHHLSISKDICLISFDSVPIFDALGISMIFFSPLYIVQKVVDIIINYDKKYTNIKQYIFLPEFIQKGSKKIE